MHTLFVYCVVGISADLALDVGMKTCGHACEGVAGQVLCCVCMRKRTRGGASSMVEGECPMCERYVPLTKGRRYCIDVGKGWPLIKQAPCVEISISACIIVWPFLLRKIFNFMNFMQHSYGVGKCWNIEIQLKTAIYKL